MVLIEKMIGVNDMNKQEKIIFENKKKKLIELGFFLDPNLNKEDWHIYNWKAGGWNNKDNKWVNPARLLNKIYPVVNDRLEYMWLHMNYYIATKTDVDRQCHACHGTLSRKRIEVNDLIVRNGKGANFNSYHVPCAINIIVEMIDTLITIPKRNALLDDILKEQEMRKQ